MAEETILVRMAEMAFVRDGMRLKTTLGSCVGLILHDKVRKHTALAHIMLPSRLRGDAVTAKYADTAVPALLQELLRRGSRKENVDAYLTGGAHLFGRSEDSRISGIGEMNLAATRELLSQLGIRVVYEDTGGERGRTVLFDNKTGSIEVKTLHPPVFQRNKS